MAGSLCRAAILGPQNTQGVRVLPGDPMSVVFFGSPPLAATVLQALLDAHIPVTAVVTQPDKPAGRGNQLKAPAVKVLALARGLQVYQPVKVRDGALAEWLRQQHAELAVVVAYGRILTQEVLDAPRLGCVNLHASLLPRWRGASPIARAIAAGDSASGMCLMRMDAGLDTGAVLARAELPIGPGDTTPMLEAKLADAGAALLLDNWSALMANRLVAQPQPLQGITWAPPLDKGEGRLDWQRKATQLHCQIRAMQPWPGAFFASAAAPAEDWKVFAEGLQLSERSGPPGQVLAVEGPLVWIGCGDGALGVAELQRPGKGRAAAADVLRGLRLGVGGQLGVVS